MRRFATHSALTALLLTATFLTPAIAGENDALRIGDAIPMENAKMKNIDGRELSIADIAGKKGTVVIFSCNSCPWVQAWEDRISSIGNAYWKKGFGVVAINSNDPTRDQTDSFDAMKQRAKERGFEFAYTVDATSDVARAFGATRTPEVFLFDQGGLLVYHGVIDDNAKSPDSVKEHYLREALEAMLAGKKIPVTETKALGCTIKFRPQ